jgi:hypothetical protein
MVCDIHCDFLPPSPGRPPKTATPKAEIEIHAGVHTAAEEEDGSKCIKL